MDEWMNDGWMNDGWMMGEWMMDEWMVIVKQASCLLVQADLVRFYPPVYKFFFSQWFSKTIPALPELELSFWPHYSSAKEQTLAWACDKRFSQLRFWYTLDFEGDCKSVGLSALDDWNPSLCMWKLGGELFPTIQLLTFQFVPVHQLPRRFGQNEPLLY